MRLTPAPIGMYGLLGARLPMWNGLERSVVGVVRHGHDHLVSLANFDLGYDPNRWHEHLHATNVGAYRWSNRDRGFPKRIARAVSDQAWLAAIAELTGSPGPT